MEEDGENGRGGTEQGDTHAVDASSHPLLRSGRLLHLEGENSKLGSLLVKEYIFRVLHCQDLLMDKVSEKVKNQRAQVYNKTVDRPMRSECPLISNLEQENQYATRLEFDG